MLNKRLIPVILIKDRLVYKTVGFKKPRYIGDPINIIHLFNEKEVDEIAILDIDASNEGRTPDFEFISKLAQECFMPMSYGGGISSVDQMSTLFKLGIEKVILNTNAFKNIELVRAGADNFGSSSIVASVDIKRSLLKKERVYVGGKAVTSISPLDLVKKYESNGAGEILLNYVDRDGMMNGFEVNSIKKIASALNIPTIACGGAGHLEHVLDLIKNTEVSAVAAGSIFIYHGPHKAVLVNYPAPKIIERLFN